MLDGHIYLSLAFSSKHFSLVYFIHFFDVTYRTTMKAIEKP